MIPVLGTAGGAVTAALAFLRARPWLLVCGLGAYAVTAAINFAVLPRWHLNGFIGQHVSGWAGELPGLILLIPVWTGLARFVILKDRTRGYFPLDVRVRRVLFATLVLSLLAMIGGLVFAGSLDAGARLQGRRSIAFALLAAAAVWKLVCWWLASRLAIAPALGAAGARKDALDTSFAYTQGAVLGILMLKFVVYGPAFVAIAILFLLGRFVEFGPAAQFASLIAITLITAATELIDVAAMSLVAIRLVRLRTASAQPGPT